MILGEVKARPKDIISFSLDYISKSKVQTSNPSSSPTPLDTPARPADFLGAFHVISTGLLEISPQQLQAEASAEIGGEAGRIRDKNAAASTVLLEVKNRVRTCPTIKDKNNMMG